MCSSAPSRTRAAFAIAAGLEQVVDYIKNLTLRRGGHRVPPFQGRLCRRIFGLPEDTSSSPATSGPSPRAPPSSPGSPSSPSALPAIQAQFIETFILLVPQPSVPHRHQVQPHRPGGGGPSGGRSSAPAGPRGRTPPSWAPGPPTSPAAPAPPAPWPTGIYGVPAGGTMAHSWVQMFPDEYTAFKTYCQLYPQQRHPAGGHLQRAANPACPTPSGPSRRSCSPWASPSAASGWTPAT